MIILRDYQNKAIKELVEKSVVLLNISGNKKLVFKAPTGSGKTVMAAEFLKQLQEVERKIKDMLYELTSTIQSTVSLFAPLIAGVTLSITTLISAILSSVQTQISGETMTELSPTFSGMSETFAAENVHPEYFVLVIGIYLIELVILLTRFTNGINEGDDKATYMYSLGKTLPLTIVVFSVTIIVGQWFFSQLIPTL
jgi:hypothetical protein